MNYIRCGRAGVPLIEDAAHAHGSDLAGTPAGGFGYAAAWGCFGEKYVRPCGGGGGENPNHPGP
ncbi:DegT/DnrJ/EryC1/StrS family aminotransferase [Nocardia abscessus]|uniref:DegT/DnrJ/EryC1/StrS family aminotransferase n=1 Tax=Nocardia abscessus TaxID=120957 RepID=UPI003CC7D259